MSVQQMKMLIYLSSNPRSTAVGKAAGGVVKELHRIGYILPVGKEGRALRWEVDTKVISNEDINQMKDLIKT